MGIKKFLTESYRSPVFAAILTIILPFAYSIYVNKNWAAVFNSIPSEIWYFLIILSILWIIIIFIRRKMLFNSFPIAFAPTYGWIYIEDLMYQGVIWKVRTPNPGPFSTRGGKPSIYIEPSPRCPKCKTKLEQSDAFYCYNWNCVNCNFSKKTWNTFDKVENRVEKIAERRLEIAEEEYNAKNSDHGF